MLSNRIKEYDYLLISIIASVIIILNQSFRDYVVTIQGFLLYALIWIIFFAFIIWSIIYLVRNIKTKKIHAVIPVLILAVTILLVNLISFDRIVANINFQIHYKEMEQVVLLVNSGELTPDYNGRIEMPSQYKDLSYEGAIFAIINNNVTLIYFVPFGIGEGDIGWVYRSDNNQLSTDDLNGLGVGFTYIEKVKDHWFYTKQMPS